MNADESYRKTNREKRMTPKRHAGWCMGCDRAFVADGAKCPVCGCVNGRKRLKKERDG